jgi:hypothetical protein
MRYYLNSNLSSEVVRCGVVAFLAIVSACSVAGAQNQTAATADKAGNTSIIGVARKAAKSSTDDTPTNVLAPAEWKRVDAAVERALTWMSSQQQEDGSYPSLDTGQPAVTSLCLMAFMAHGHAPGHGQYGLRLERAADFVLACQKENGLLAKVGIDVPEISRELNAHLGTCTAYDHAISSLLISELYGMSEPRRAQRMEGAVKRALDATLKMQRWPKDKESDKGGWRYVDDRDESDSDLSVTGWNLMFLRSARNAGFDVPKAAIDDAVTYIRRCYSKKYGTFEYWIDRMDGRTRGMAGAGILALAHAGYHNSAEAQSTGAWILKQKFESYNESVQNPDTRVVDRYHYSLFNCCQGMYQLGGKYWSEFFPRVVPVLLANQQADGSWPADSYRVDAKFGNAYTTALVVIALGAPNQLLPIFQR